MQLVDFSAEQSEGKAKLNKVTPRKDPDVKEGRAVLFDVDLVFQIPTQEEMDVLDETLQGVAKVYEFCAESGRKRKMEGAPADPNRRLIVSGGDEQSGMILAESPAEVRKLVVHIDGKAAVLTAKMRLHGFPPQKCGNLISHLGMMVDIDMMRPQQVLRFPDREGVTPEVGNLVVVKSGDLTVTGLVRSIDEEAGDLSVEDFGERHLVKLDDVQNVLRVCGVDDQSVDDQGERYAGAAREGDRSPSWSSILCALGRATSNGGEESKDGWVLTDEILAEAAGVEPDALVPPEA